MYNTYESLIQGLLENGHGSVDNWFSAPELEGLRKTLLGRYGNDDFHLAGIGNKDNLQTVRQIRRDRVLWLNKCTAVASEQCFFAQIDGFVDYLNRTCFAGIHSYEFHYAVYETGAFYKRHIDRFSNDDRRRFSFVCYLTEFWEPGDGGELRLYDKGGTVVVEPKPGRILFFSSDLPHEVLVTQHRRLSITGWLKTL